MLSTKLKSLKDSRGFTIVELLIVIIVIAILATLVITAYNGVQAKARDVKRHSDAGEVQKAAEAYKADHEGYPVTTANITDSANAVKLDSGIVANFGAPSSSAKDKIGVYICPTSTGGDGMQIKYYKEQATAGVQTIALGSQTSCSTTSLAP